MNNARKNTIKKHKKNIAKTSPKNKLKNRQNTQQIKIIKIYDLRILFMFMLFESPVIYRLPLPMESPTGS